MKGIRLFIVAFWKNAVLQLGDSRIQLILQSYNPTRADYGEKHTTTQNYGEKHTHLQSTCMDRQLRRIVLSIIDSQITIHTHYTLYHHTIPVFDHT